MHKFRKGMLVRVLVDHPPGSTRLKEGDIGQITKVFRSYYDTDLNLLCKWPGMDVYYVLGKYVEKYTPPLLERKVRAYLKRELRA